MSARLLTRRKLASLARPEPRYIPKREQLERHAAEMRQRNWRNRVNRQNALRGWQKRRAAHAVA